MLKDIFIASDFILLTTGQSSIDRSECRGDQSAKGKYIEHD